MSVGISVLAKVNMWNEGATQTKLPLNGISAERPAKPAGACIESLFSPDLFFLYLATVQLYDRPAVRVKRYGVILAPSVSECAVSQQSDRLWLLLPLSLNSNAMDLFLAILSLVLLSGFSQEDQVGK